VLAVPTGPTAGDDPLADPVAERNRITHPTAARWARLFNARYQILIGALWLAMLLLRANPKRSELVNHAIFQEMRQTIKRLARRLVTLPRRTDGSKVAAPPFEAPNEGWPSDADGLRAFVLNRLATSDEIIGWLESPDNPFPITNPDKLIVNGVRNSDVSLRAALEP
jgi:hypothetical protein